MLEVIAAFEKACGKKLPYSFKPRRAGDIAECYADASKAKRELGWQAELGINEIAYYHMLFDAYTFMLYEAYQNGLISESHKFWDKNDVRIMRRGVSHESDYGFWLLAKISPKWMAQYYANDLSPLWRRTTNIMLTCCQKFFYK